MNIRFYNAQILILNESEEFEVIRGELWVVRDRIVYVGEADRPVEVLAGLGMDMILWEREVDCEENLLMPGFKNAHAHTYMTFLRSFADDLPLKEWLFQMCFPMEEKLTEENIRPFEIIGIMEYLSGGVTTSFDMCYFPPVYAQVSADCGFRSVQVSGVNSFGGRIEVVEENYLRVNELSDLTSFFIGFHAEYTTKPELMEGIAKLAQKYKSPVFLHNSETESETAECVERYGKTPTQLTDEMGMYEYGGGGFHCVYCNEEDIRIFRERDLSAITCPASNLKLASGIMPLKRFYDAGINLAIGTDGAASNNCLDMFREMFLASTLVKVSERDAVGVSADRILYMATAGGAKAMGLSDCDRLAAGKKADLILIDLKQPNMQPENNLIKNLVYSGNRENVLLTMIDGKIRYERGKYFIGTEPTDVYREANEIVRFMRRE